MNLLLYECLECGHKKLGGNKLDGARCEKCNGPIVPRGEYKCGVDLAKGNDFSVIGGKLVENKQGGVNASR